MHFIGLYCNCIKMYGAKNMLSQLSLLSS